jgi:hypothetical protein
VQLAKISAASSSVRNDAIAAKLVRGAKNRFVNNCKRIMGKEIDSLGVSS